jgi:hypothetical protein
MSTNLKNPNDQDDHKKGMLRDQPPLLHDMLTALLASREGQPIPGVSSFGTDFETHSYIQGYHGECLTSASTVTHLFGDEDPDADCLKVKATAAKEFAQTDKLHGNHELSQAQEVQLKVIAMTEESDKAQVEAEALASKAYELACTIAPGKAQGTHMDKHKQCLQNPIRAVKDKQQSTLVQKFGNPLMTPGI